MTRRLPIFALLGSLYGSVFVTGCDQGDEQGSGDPLGAPAQGVEFGAHGDEPALAASLPHESAVRLLMDDSPIHPWCGGVLVAPDVVVTAAACVEGYGTFWFSVALDGRRAGETIAVERIVTLEQDPRLAALVLEASAVGVQPAEVVDLTEERCDVHSVSYYYALEDEPTERWSWSGCYAPDTRVLRPTEGSPNCHGDSGAPAFVGDDGLVGVVVAASGRDLCVDQVELAGPGSGAFDEAMALSR